MFDKKYTETGYDKLEFSIQETGQKKHKRGKTACMEFK